MDIPIKYFLGYVIFCALLIIAPHAYSHWHFEVISPVEFYQIDKERYEDQHGCEVPYMSYSEWQDDQERRSEALGTEIGYQITESFDPWFERPDKTEKGRD